jgi:aldehyde dehydrogenase family protein
MSTDRIIIHQSLAERFIPRYVERVQALPVGEPAVPATIVGPLINTRGAQRISALVKDAAAKGATLLTGDGAIEGPNGTLIRPVVLTDVRPDMDIFASEIFGPVTVIHPVDSAEAAIDLANDTEYGLTGGVISRDLNAALDVVSRVRSGIIHINDQGIADEPMAPFGGVKNTGYGSSAAPPVSSRSPSSAGSRSSTAAAPPTRSREAPRPRHLQPAPRAGIKELFEEVQPLIFGLLAALRRQAVARLAAHNPASCHQSPPLPDLTGQVPVGAGATAGVIGCSLLTRTPGRYQPAAAEAGGEGRWSKRSRTGLGSTQARCSSGPAVC